MLSAIKAKKDEVQRESYARTNITDILDKGTKWTSDFKSLKEREYDYHSWNNWNTNYNRESKKKAISELCSNSPKTTNIYFSSFLQRF